MIKKIKFIGDDKKLNWWNKDDVYEVFELNGHLCVLDDEGDKMIINKNTIELFEVIE